jgi:hypothetical protein
MQHPFLMTEFFIKLLMAKVSKKNSSGARAKLGRLRHARVSIDESTTMTTPVAPDKAFETERGDEVRRAHSSARHGRSSAAAAAAAASPSRTLQRA